MKLAAYEWSGNPRGLAGDGPYRPLDIERYLAPQLGWAQLIVGGDEYVEAAAQLVEGGCTPIVRIYRSNMGAMPAPEAWYDIYRQYIDAGVRWFELYDEPNSVEAWPQGPDGEPEQAITWENVEGVIAPLAANWLEWAEGIADLGGYPAFPALATDTGPDGSTVYWLNALMYELGESSYERFLDVAESGLWCATHPQMINHYYQEPPGGPRHVARPYYQQRAAEPGWHFEYPYDPILQRLDPGRTVFGGTPGAPYGDTRGLVAAGEAFQRLLKHHFELDPLPVVATAGGITPIPRQGQPAIQQDGRYPPYSHDSHAEAIMALWRWVAESGPPWFFGATLQSEHLFYDEQGTLLAIEHMIAAAPVLKTIVVKQPAPEQPLVKQAPRPVESVEVNGERVTLRRAGDASQARTGAWGDTDDPTMVTDEPPGKARTARPAQTDGDYEEMERTGMAEDYPEMEEPEEDMGLDGTPPGIPPIPEDAPEIDEDSGDTLDVPSPTRKRQDTVVEPFFEQDEPPQTGVEEVPMPEGAEPVADLEGDLLEPRTWGDESEDYPERELDVDYVDVDGQFVSAYEDDEDVPPITMDDLPPDMKQRLAQLTGAEGPESLAEEVEELEEEGVIEGDEDDEFGVDDDEGPDEEGGAATESYLAEPDGQFVDVGYDAGDEDDEEIEDILLDVYDEDEFTAEEDAEADADIEADAAALTPLGAVEPVSGQSTARERTDAQHPGAATIEPGHHWLVVSPDIDASWLLDGGWRYWRTYRPTIVADATAVALLPDDDSALVTIIGPAATIEQTTEAVRALRPAAEIDPVVAVTLDDLRAELNWRAQHGRRSQR